MGPLARRLGRGRGRGRWALLLLVLWLTGCGSTAVTATRATPSPTDSPPVHREATATPTPPPPPTSTVKPRPTPTASLTPVPSATPTPPPTASPTHAPTRPAGRARGLAGWYTSSSEPIAELAAFHDAGVNLIALSDLERPTTGGWLLAAEEDGIRVMLEIPTSWLRHGRYVRLRAVVQRYRTSPALYAWYLADEPDFTRLSPSRLVAAYQLIKALDPVHPVATTFVTGQCRFGQGGVDPRYLQGFDLLMFVRYPFYENLPGVSPLADSRTLDAACVRTARRHHKLGPIMVLQGFGNGVKDGPFTWRDPTDREISCSFRIALASGAKGALFWDQAHADAHLKRVVDEVIRRWRFGGELQGRHSTGPPC